MNTPATKSDRIERMRPIIAKLRAMGESERAAMIAAHGAVVTVEGRNLSPVNSCLLITQRPGVSVVGGFRQWLAAGRVVAKGERGLSIWIPCVRKGAAPAECGPIPDADSVFFRLATVFDIAQTVELPCHANRVDESECVA